MTEAKETLQSFARVTIEIFLVLQGLTLLLEAPIGAASNLQSFLKYMPVFEVLSDWTVAGWILSLAHLVLAAIIAIAAVAGAKLFRLPVAAVLEVAAIALTALLITLIAKLLIGAYGTVPSYLQPLTGRWGSVVLLVGIFAIAYRYAPRPTVIARLRGAGKVFTLALIVLLLVPVARGVRIVDYYNVHPAVPLRGHASPGAPNIMLLIIDTMSAPAMSLYGNKTPTTPNLDRLAPSATVFDRYTAVSNFTVPTVATILSGMEPSWHRVIAIGSYFRRSKEDLLPQRLHAAGYETISVATNYYALPQKYRIENGFDAAYIPASICPATDYFGLQFTHSNIGVTIDLFPSIGSALGKWDSLHCASPRAFRHPSRAAYDLAIDRVNHRQEPQRPYFVIVHTLPPHAPYLPPPPFLKMFEKSGAFVSEADYRLHSSIFSARIAEGAFPTETGRLHRRYYESIRYADYELQRFLDRAKAEGLLRNTVVIITADHGESFEGWVGHAGPLLTQPLIAVPLVMMGPGIPANTRINSLVSEADLAPTILALAHAPIPARMTGHSLVGLLRGGPPTGGPVFSATQPRDSVTSTLTTGNYAMIENNWKYVQSLDDRKEYLFDLGSNASEHHDLAGQKPAIVSLMRARLDAHFVSQKVPYGPN